MSSKPLRVAYIHSEELVEAANALPANVGRHRLAHELIRAHGLLEFQDEAAEDDEGEDGGRARAYVVEPGPATREQLMKFHDERFVGELGRRWSLARCFADDLAPYRHSARTRYGSLRLRA
jgi:acetoin utilization deacetylase AcuC-like enzyme